jgi:uncharacterized protein
LHIRDPIHGAIEITADERALLDTPQYQRLRNVKQLGFADLAFPGATHTRYAHGLGAMAMATRVFETLAPQLEIPGDDRARLRQTLRLAVLFHDLGHAPLSHATESIMPPVDDLRLPAWVRSGGPRRANHEDYTLKLLLDSGLTAEIRSRFAKRGIEPEHIAALISGLGPPKGSPFIVGRRDLHPVLRQVVSGELDADRMDYLQRDSFFTGVNYGKFDADWIVQNLAVVQRDDKVHLGLLHRAVFAFEDFLLSRYHMFLSVYYHSTSVGYEVLLQRFCESGEYRLPADADEYLQHDDVALICALRASKNPWALRVVRRHGYRVLLENAPGENPAELYRVDGDLKAAGIDSFVTQSRGVLSRYGKEVTLWVTTPTGVTPIAEYTPLYERYAEAVTLGRLYVEPEKWEDARRLLTRR